MQESDTNYVINSLAKEQFADYFSYSKEQLSEIGASIVEVKANPGIPCRVSLSDVAVGEKVLSISYTHLDAESPYKSSGPIFIQPGVEALVLGTNEIPKLLLHRHLSIRAYDNRNLMVDCEVIKGESTAGQLNKMFGSQLVEYIHIHNAGPGCFICSAHRIQA